MLKAPYIVQLFTVQKELPRTASFLPKASESEKLIHKQGLICWSLLTRGWVDGGKITPLHRLNKLETDTGIKK